MTVKNLESGLENAGKAGTGVGKDSFKMKTGEIGIGSDAGPMGRKAATERKQDKLLPIGKAFGSFAVLVPTPLGFDLYLWLVYRTFNLAPLRLAWRQLYRQFGGVEPRKGDVVPGEQITQSDR